MNRALFPSLGAAALVLVAAAYLVASLAAGHSAASQIPPDLSAQERGLDPYRAAHLMVEQHAQVLDVRSPREFAAFHLPGAQHVPGASAARVAGAAGGRATLVVASSDAAAEDLVATALARSSELNLHFLRGGAQAWYTTFELPTPLFNEEPPPFGYRAARSKLRPFLDSGRANDPDAIKAALGKLSEWGYEPASLGTDKKPVASGKRKKITGGCGG